MKPSFFNKTLLSFGVALAILLAIGYVSFQSIERLLQAAEQSKRFSLMMQDFTMLLAQAQYLQNAGRGYVITGDEAFLEGYGETAKTLIQKIQQLRSHAGTPAVYRQQLDTLAALVQNIVSSGEETIQQRRQKGFEAAQRVVMDRQGIQLLHVIQGKVAEIEAANQVRLQNEERTVRAKVHETEITILFGSFAALFFIGMIGFMLYDENREHRKADAALEKAYEDLAQRNRNLLEVNQRLEEEIAERKKMEQQLAFQASILSHVGDAVVAHDRNLQITYWNPMAERLFGWKAEEALGQKAPELLRANTTLADHEKALAILNQGASLIGEAVVHHKNGRRVEIETHTIALRNGQSEVIGYVNVNRDLTERRRLEEAIRLQSVIVNNMAEGVCLVRDRDGLIVYVNPKFERMFGYEPGELIDKPVNILNYAGGGDPAGVRDAILASLREKGEAGFEVWNVKKDGTPFWCWAHISGLNHPEHGKIWVAIHEDITARKQAEEKLAFQASIIDQVGDAVIALDESMHVTYWNPAAEAMYGWKAEAVWGLFEPEVVRSRMSEAERKKATHQLQEKNAVYSGEIIHHHKDGRELLVENRTVAFKDSNGQITGYLAVNRDITVRKQAEETIRRNAARLQTLDEISKALNETGAETNTIINAIAQQIAKLIGDGCGIRLLAEDGENFMTGVFYHPDPENAKFMEGLLAASPQRKGESISGRVAKTGEALFMPEIDQEQIRAMLKPAYLPHLDRYGVYGVIGVPIRVRDRVLGTLGISRDQPGRPYTNEDLIITQEIADRLALALENARLFEAIQHERALLEQRVEERTMELSKANFFLQTEIIERKLAEEALQAAQAHLQIVADAMPVVVTRCSRDLIYLWVNKPGEKLLNRPASEIIGRPIEEIFGQESFNRFLPYYQRVLSGEKINLEEEVDYQGVGRRWVNAIYTPTFDAAGVPDGWVAVILDITERKRIENEVRRLNAELEERVRTRTREFESANQELESAKQKLENEIAERQKAEEAIQRHAKRLQILDEVSEALVAAKPDTSAILNVVVRRVAELIGEACSINLLSEDRQWWNQMAVYHPDSEMLEFAAELANSSPLRADQGISGLVLKTGEAVILNDLSPALFRTTVNEKYWPFLERYATFSNLVAPLRLQNRVAGTLVVARYQPGNPYTNDDRIVLQELADRTAMALENARLFDEVQQERALLAQRVEARTVELRAANQELTKANRMKDEFLATMSHELRTPLNAILGISEALQERIYGDLTERQQKALRNLEESGRHLLALINDILDLSKMASGKFDLHIAAVAVENVCQASLRLVQPLLQKKQLNLAVNFDARVSRIQADERRLKEMLVNLLSNAIKFTPEGGAIGLEVVGDSEKRLACFSVWDTGIGIAREDLDRLFRPFVQVDSSLTRQYGGAGLGLVLVHRMAELHGGRVEVESEPGKGSRFTIALPWE